MNFIWAGQSCCSTSRVFLHESHHDDVLERVVQAVKMCKAGVPTDMSTTMGPFINKAAYARVLSFIESGKSEGAQIVSGGTPCPVASSIEGGFSSS
jgi:betaine-aldehyde dehydrogenase